MDKDEYDAATSIAGVIIAASLSFAIAFWVWPWLGPQVFQPCPQFTGLGIGLYTAWHALRGAGNLMRERRLKFTEAKLAKHEAAHQVWRELLMGKR